MGGVFKNEQTTGQISKMWVSWSHPGSNVSSGQQCLNWRGKMKMDHAYKIKDIIVG